MKKILLGAILVLLLTIGFGVYYLLSNLDSIVKVAIEKYGSEATQTAVRVDNVNIILKDGSGAVWGLTVGSPQGFAAPQVFSLGEITTRIDLDSLSKDVLVIDHIIIRSPKVFFELNAAGKNNLGQLKQNLSTSTSSASKSEKTGGAEPKLMIRKLQFENGTIHASVIPLNKDYTLNLQGITMNNLGGSNGATPKQIADQVIKVLTDRALDEVRKKGLDQYKQQLEGEVNKRLDRQKEKLDERDGGKLKELLNR